MSSEEREARSRERAALNEALFRDVNERIQELGFGQGDRVEAVCECGSIDCTVPLQVTVDEYAQVRADPTTFVVAPGHALPEIEDVVSVTERFEIVRKKSGESRIALETAPDS
jgi:hypothetical protein